MLKRYHISKLITAPIYYANGAPHLGHLYTSVAVDVLKRWEEVIGKVAFSSFGVDEHGNKVSAAAESSAESKEKVCIQSYLDRMNAEFYRLLEIADITPTEWIRTTSNDHKTMAAWLWNKIEANGHFYDGEYEGWYSKSDEAYYKDEDVKDGVAIASGSTVEWAKESCIFFNIAHFKEPLLEYYKSNTDVIKPSTRYNEVMGLLQQELPPLPVSRTRFTWGIPVPGRSGHVMYVWLDALANYLTFIMRLQRVKTPEEVDFSWLQSMTHIIGKDILKFHAIYWPAFLLAAALPLPKRVFAHGWLITKDGKMSKSKGNSVDPFELLSKYGSDKIRYLLMRGANFGNDSQFIEEDIAKIGMTELANEIGNLSQRILAFCANKYGEIPVCQNLENPILEVWDKALKTAERAMQDENISEYLNITRLAVIQTNTYINQVEPWKLENARELMGVLCLCVQRMAILLSPVIPDACKKISETMSMGDLTIKEWSHCPTRRLDKPVPLFQKESKQAEPITYQNINI